MGQEMSVQMLNASEGLLAYGAELRPVLRDFRDALIHVIAADLLSVLPRTHPAGLLLQSTKCFILNRVI
jgi:hypothetical protein